MKISVSNIAWYRDPKKIESFLEFISDLGVVGWSWHLLRYGMSLESTEEDRLETRKKLKITV